MDSSHNNNHTDGRCSGWLLSLWSPRRLDRSKANVFLINLNSSHFQRRSLFFGLLGNVRGNAIHAWSRSWVLYNDNVHLRCGVYDVIMETYSISCTFLGYRVRGVRFSIVFIERLAEYTYSYRYSWSAFPFIMVVSAF